MIAARLERNDLREVTVSVTSRQGRTPKSAIVTTLLNLVQTVQAHADSDDEVVAVIAHLIDSGRVILGGNFAGARIRVAQMGVPA